MPKLKKHFVPETTCAIPEFFERLVNGAAAAGALKISRRTLESPSWRYRLPHYTFGKRCIRYDLDELAEFIKKTFHKEGV